MSLTDTSASLIAAISDLQEEQALALVRRRLETGDDPLMIIQDCKEGMRLVGTHYDFTDTSFDDLEFDVARSIGDREIGLRYSVDAQRVALELGGLGLMR